MPWPKWCFSQHQNLVNIDRLVLSLPSVCVAWIKLGETGSHSAGEASRHQHPKIHMEFQDSPCHYYHRFVSPRSFACLQNSLVVNLVPNLGHMQHVRRTHVRRVTRWDVLLASLQPLGLRALARGVASPHFWRIAWPLLGAKWSNYDSQVE